MPKLPDPIKVRFTEIILEALEAQPTGVDPSTEYHDLGYDYSVAAGSSVTRRKRAFRFVKIDEANINIVVYEKGNPRHFSVKIQEHY